MVRVRRMLQKEMPAVAGLAGQLGYPATTEQIESRFLALDGSPESALFAAENEAGLVVGWAQWASH